MYDLILRFGAIGTRISVKNCTLIIVKCNIYESCIGVLLISAINPLLLKIIKFRGHFCFGLNYTVCFIMSILLLSKTLHSCYL